MAALLLGPNGYQDQVIGSIDAGKLHWIARPDGVIKDLKVFTSDGRLWPAAVVGVYSKLIPGGAGCWPSIQDTISVPLNSTALVRNGPWTLRMSYVATAAQRISVTFGGQSVPLSLKAGENTAYLPVEGSGDSVLIDSPDPGALCVGNLAVGGIFQNKSGTPVPRRPVPG